MSILSNLHFLNDRAQNLTAFYNINEQISIDIDHINSPRDLCGQLRIDIEKRKI